MKKLLAPLTSLVLILSLCSATVSNAATWTPPNREDRSQQLITVGNTYWPRVGSVVNIGSHPNGSKLSTMNRGCFGVYPWPNYDNFKCGKEEVLAQWKEVQRQNDPSLLSARLTMPNCESDRDTFCISDVRIGKSGESSTATFDRYLKEDSLNVNHSSPAIPEIGLPHGGTPGIWRAQSAAHAGESDSFVVNVEYVTTWHLQTNPKGALEWLPWYDNLKMEVVPFSITPKSELKKYVKPSTAVTSAILDIGGYECKDPVFVEYITCGEQEYFSPDTNVGVTIRMDKSASGWFIGRLANPNITIEQFAWDYNINSISISGDAITIPKLAVFAVRGDPGFTTTTPKFIGDNYSSDPIAQKMWEPFRILAKDKASGYATVWSLDIFGISPPCYIGINRVLGIITTNALAYQGVPTFPKLNSPIEYSVVGMHYNADGSVTKGVFNMVINSDLARCLYNLPKEPLQANVAIIYPDGGASSVATVILREDKEQGWVHLAASNFTFSNPTIKVTFEKEGTKPALAVSKSAAAVTKTIICLKGKVSKTVTGAKPLCPAGYKKK